MRWSWWAARSRTVLLVVVGVLLVPTIALGARLASSWQTGSVVVKKFGPLPTYSWVMTDNEVNGSFGSSRSATMPLPPVNLGGAITDQVAFQTTITIPQSVADGLGSILASGASACYVELSWGPVNSAYQTDPYILILAGFILLPDDDEALSAMTGTHTYPATLSTLGAGMAETLPDGAVGLRILCEGGSEPSDLGDSPITFTVNSVRVLAY